MAVARPHLRGLRQYFCAFHRTLIAAYDNVPELKGMMLVRVFQEMTPFLEDGSPKLLNSNHLVFKGVFRKPDWENNSCHICSGKQPARIRMNVPHPHAVATGKTLHPYLTESQKASREADEQWHVQSTEEEVRHGRLTCRVKSHCFWTPKCKRQAKLATALSFNCTSF